MRTLLIAALFAAPFAANAQDKPGIDAEAKKVIEKAIEAQGGKEALEKYPASSSKIKGQMSMLGMDIPFTGEIVTSGTDKVRTQLDAEVQGQKMEILQIVNGDKVKQTVSGAEQPLTDETKKELLQTPMVLEISSMTPLLKGDKYTVKSEKDEKVGDADTSVVLITAKGLKDVRLFFDKKTGLMVKITRKSLGIGDGPEPIEVTEETIVSDYKAVDGVKMPAKSVTMHDGKKFMTIEVTEMKLMDKADAKKFALDD